MYIFPIFQVDIAYFPYDEQKCQIKFGTWSYDGQYVDLSILEHLGMDVSYYTRSNEWDIMNITVVRHEVVYPGCCGQKVRQSPLYSFTIIILSLNKL